MAADEITKADWARTGVYAIKNKTNGKIYVGSAARSFRSRWATHVSRLKAGTHHSKHLQAAFNLYGEASFELTILAFCDPADCVTQEQRYIEEHSSVLRGYNISPTAGSPLGIKQTKETIAKRVAKMKGQVRSAEVREKMKISQSRRGKEVFDKISAARRGCVISQEQRDKISATLRGRKMPPRTTEYREKVSARQSGRKLSEETRARISASKTGKKLPPFSPEHCSRISASKRGKKVGPLSLAHRQKISEGVKRYRVPKAQSQLFGLLASLPNELQAIPVAFPLTRAAPIPKSEQSKFPK